MAIVMIQHESALVTMSGGTDEGSVDPGNGDFGYHSVLSVIAMTILQELETAVESHTIQNWDCCYLPSRNANN